MCLRAALIPGPRTSPTSARPAPNRTGDYMVASKWWRGKGAEGSEADPLALHRVWVIGRTLVKSKADLKNVWKIQNTYRIVPLKKWNPETARAYPSGRSRSSTWSRTKPTFREPARVRSAEFFDALGIALARFKAPARDDDSWPDAGRLWASAPVTSRFETTSSRIRNSRPCVTS